MAELVDFEGVEPGTIESNDDTKRVLMETRSCISGCCVLFEEWTRIGDAPGSRSATLRLPRGSVRQGKRKPHLELAPADKCASLLQWRRWLAFWLSRGTYANEMPIQVRRPRTAGAGATANRPQTKQPDTKAEDPIGAASGQSLRPPNNSRRNGQPSNTHALSHAATHSHTHTHTHTHTHWKVTHETHHQIIPLPVPCESILLLVWSLVFGIACKKKTIWRWRGVRGGAILGTTARTTTTNGGWTVNENRERQ